MDELTISAVARRAGVRPSAIRYYESIGLLPSPARMSGRRRYSPEVLPRLALIAAAQHMGFTIAEIGTLMHGFDPDTPASERWQTLAAKKLPEIEALIARAQGMKRLLEEALQCQCLSLDACARLSAASSYSYGRSVQSSRTNGGESVIREAAAAEYLRVEEAAFPRPRHSHRDVPRPQAVREGTKRTEVRAWRDMTHSPD